MLPQAKTDWNLDILIENIKDVETYKTVVSNQFEKFIKKWNSRVDYLKEPKILKQVLDEYNKLYQTYGNYNDLMYYYSLKSALNLNDSDTKAKYNKIHTLALDLHNKTQFFIIRISKISKIKQKVFLESSILEEYKHFLEKQFKAGEHILSEKEEIILNLKTKVSHSNWTQMLSGLLSKEEKHVWISNDKKAKRNFSELVELSSDKNKKVRDSAAKALSAIFVKYSSIAENEFNSVLENKKINDQIRDYKNPDESRYIADDIEPEVVHLLQNVVSQNFDIAHEYYQLKAQILGVNKLDYNDRNVEIGRIANNYSFEKSFDLVRKTFSNLDPYFEKFFIDSFGKGLVDVYPKKGKRSGAFCSCFSSQLPIYILLNHGQSLNSALTMAHEFGHAINFDLSRKQKELNYDFPMCTAETASTFFEDFVLQEILNKTTNKQQKLGILMSKLNDDISTIFRQIAFYNFEIEIHTKFREKGYLSSKEIGGIFRKHMESYMGPYVKQNFKSEYWWIYISHFRSFFYVYSYSFGLLVSKALQNMVKNDKNNIIKVKEFFSIGAKLSPQHALQDLGINISQRNFWETGINEVRNLLQIAKQMV